MPAFYRNIRNGIVEQRPTTAEIVRTRFSDISGGDRHAIAPGNVAILERMDEERRRARELLVPLILECMDRLDEQWPQDTTGAMPFPEFPETFAPSEEEDIAVLHNAPLSTEELLGRLRSSTYQLLMSNALAYISDGIVKRDLRLVELSQRRVRFLRYFKNGQTPDPHTAIQELLVSGFGTANDMAWDIARAIPAAYAAQYATGIDAERHAQLVERSQTLCEPLASLHQHTFVALEDRIKRGRTPPTVPSGYGENAFADPAYFWLASGEQTTEPHAVELSEDAFPVLLTPNVIGGFTCPGKGKSIQRILLRTAALCRRFVAPRMNEINAAALEDTAAASGKIR